MSIDYVNLELLKHIHDFESFNKFNMFYGEYNPYECGERLFIIKTPEFIVKENKLNEYKFKKYPRLNIYKIQGKIQYKKPFNFNIKIKIKKLKERNLNYGFN